MNAGGSRRDPANRICVGSLDGGQAKPVILSSFNAQYANGYLLFIRGGDRGGSLLAQPFDPVRLETSGETVTVAEHVAVYEDTLGSAASLLPRRGRSSLTAHAFCREWNGMTGPGDRPARSESPPYAGFRASRPTAPGSVSTSTTL
jgi:hypothetical protein